MTDVPDITYDAMIVTDDSVSQARVKVDLYSAKHEAVIRGDSLPYDMSLEDVAKMHGIGTWTSCLRILDSTPSTKVKTPNTIELPGRATLQKLQGRRAVPVVFRDGSSAAWERGTRYDANAAFKILKENNRKSHWILVKDKRERSKVVPHLIFGVAKNIEQFKAMDHDASIEDISKGSYTVVFESIRSAHGKVELCPDITLSIDSYGSNWVVAARPGREGSVDLEWKPIENIPKAYKDVMQKREDEIEKKKRAVHNVASPRRTPRNTPGKRPAEDPDINTERAKQAVAASRRPQYNNRAKGNNVVAPSQRELSIPRRVEGYISVMKNGTLEKTHKQLEWMESEFSFIKDGQICKIGEKMTKIYSASYELSMAQEILAYTFVNALKWYLMFEVPVMQKDGVDIDIDIICEHMKTAVATHPIISVKK